MDRLCEWLLRVPNQRRVKCRGDGQARHAVTFILQCSLSCFDRRSGTCQHNLIVRVPVRQINAGEVRQLSLDLRVRTSHRQHGARVEAGMRGRGHTRAARFHQVEVSGFVQYARSPERGQFAETVTRHKIGAETGFGKYLIQPGAYRSDGGLSVIGTLQRRSLRGLRIGARHGRRINHLRDRLFPIGAEERIYFMESFAQNREVKQ